MAMVLGVAKEAWVVWISFGLFDWFTLFQSLLTKCEIVDDCEAFRVGRLEPFSNDPQNGYNRNRCVVNASSNLETWVGKLSCTTLRVVIPTTRSVVRLKDY